MLLRFVVYNCKIVANKILFDTGGRPCAGKPSRTEIKKADTGILLAPAFSYISKNNPQKLIMYYNLPPLVAIPSMNCFWKIR